MFKKAILSLVFFVCTTVSSAQIQKNILDFTLGTTSKEQVCSYFKSHNIIYTLGNSGEVVVDGLQFAGWQWGFSHFSFYDNKLYSVQFTSTGLGTPEATLDLLFDKYKNLLSNKYNCYKNAFTSGQLGFSDNEIELTLYYEKYQGVRILSIEYIHLPLFRRLVKAQEDEL